MTYNTPELLSVGSAQNLVLAGFHNKFEEFSNLDDSPTIDQYIDLPGGDDSRW